MITHPRTSTKGFIVRVLVCTLFAGLCLYSFLDRQNGVTELHIKLPKLAKELKAIEEENDRLQYEIEQFENPQHLMELARRPEFSHLKHPLFKEILTLKEGSAVAPIASSQQQAPASKPLLTSLLGSLMTGQEDLGRSQ